MKRKSALALLLILGLAEANVYVVRPEPDTRKRTLLVEVRETGTNSPLPGALVRVGGARSTAATDSHGRVRFPVKVTLSQEVTASCFGYENGTDTPWLMAADTVAVSLELVPTRPRTTTGMVVDAEGVPQPHARVWIDADTAVTDSAGRFVLALPHISPLNLQVFHAALQCLARDIRLVGHDSVVVDAVLYDSTARGDVVGRVYDGWKGGVVVGACLTVEGTDLGIPTDVNGDYAFRGLKPGDYVIACHELFGGIRKRVSVMPDRRARCDFHPRGVY